MYHHHGIASYYVSYVQEEEITFCDHFKNFWVGSLRYSPFEICLCTTATVKLV